MLSFQVLNILSSDSYSLFEAALFCPLPATILILMAVCVVYAFFILGSTALIGISVYVLFIPIQVMAGLCHCTSHTLSLKWTLCPGPGPEAWALTLASQTVQFFLKLEFEYPGEGEHVSSVCQSPQHFPCILAIHAFASSAPTPVVSPRAHQPQLKGGIQLRISCQLPLELFLTHSNPWIFRPTATQQFSEHTVCTSISDVYG